MIGLVVICIIQLLQIEVKRKMSTSKDFYLPIMSCTCWFVMIFPFLVYVPIMFLYFNNNTTEFIMFIRNIFKSSSLLIFIVVSILAVIATFKISQVEYEKKVKYVVESLTSKMDTNAVLADSMVLRLIFEEYLRIINDLVEKDKLKHPHKYE